MKLALALVAVAACGESPARELVVVAHPDDDMLFMASDLLERVRAHEPLTVVYVTAGDAGQGLARVDARARGARFAYGTVAGSQAWTCEAERCRLGELELVFLGYPDGGVLGEASGSLLRLWEGSITRATTISAHPISYDREQLIEAVADIIDDAHPQTIRTLEIAGTHGNDHSDHMLVGALVQLALARSTSEAEVVAYRGYNIDAEPPNIDEPTYAAASVMMRAYLACTSSCGVCGETPCETIDDARYVSFLHRRYPVETVTVDDGRLCTDGGCLDDVDIDEDGLVRVGALCLEVDGDRVVAGECERDPERHFQLDEEGHLWASIAPASTPGMLYDHQSCVWMTGGILRVGRCGAAHDVRWTLR